MNQTQNKNLEYYMSLPYTIELTPDEDGYWFAKIPLLEGCMTNGENVYDAIDMIEDAKRGWLMTALDLGIHIPEPEEAVVVSQLPDPNIIIWESEIIKVAGDTGGVLRSNSRSAVLTPKRGIS